MHYLPTYLDIEEHEKITYGNTNQVLTKRKKLHMVIPIKFKNKLILKFLTGPSNVRLR